jgi:hypothetical protein
MVEVGVQEKASSVDVGGSLHSSSSFLADVEAGTLLNEPKLYPAAFDGFVYVRYLDHVVFNRSSALVMAPQTREAVGWLVYECSEYVILAFDRDAGPPTLKGGDPKASGLVLLKSDVLELKKFEKLSPQRIFEYYLNCKGASIKNRVGASSHRSEKLSPNNKRKGQK